MFSFKKKCFLIILVLILILIPFLNEIVKPYPKFTFIHNVIDNYKSYFAAVFSLIFATYTFYSQRKETFDKELKEKEKDRDSKKDQYRPIFVVEENHSNSFNVKLIMKEQHLYLENIMVQPYNSNLDFVGISSHNSIIKKNINSKIFFITGKTLIGETFIFGYINKLRIYKYLKSRELEKSYTPKMNIEDFSEIWKSFNTIEESPNGNETKAFIVYTEKLREIISKSDDAKIKEILNNASIKKALDDILEKARKYYTRNNTLPSQELMEVINIYENNLTKLIFIHENKPLLQTLWFYTISNPKLNKLSSEATYNYDVEKDYPEVIKIVLNYAREILVSKHHAHNIIIDFFEDIVEVLYFNENSDDILSAFNTINIILD